MQQLSTEEHERIRRAYHIEHKNIRTIAKEFRHSRTTVSKAIAEDTKTPQQVTHIRQTPVFGPHQSRVEELLRLNEHMLRKQHYTSHKIFEIIQSAGWEKGQVEQGVGFSRRNFMVPIPDVASFEDLNLYLLQQCLKDDQRRVQGQTMTIGQAWEYERHYLRLLPAYEYDCCVTVSARLTPYSQVIYETNRYSVPVKRARRDAIIKAYPFHLEIYDQTTKLASHPRSYEREQDMFDPLHYLPLLEKRPGAFDYAKPIRRWKEDWPESYHRTLRILREKWPDGRGVQEFVRILQLHQDYSTQILKCLASHTASGSD